MQERTIYITEQDLERLHELIREQKRLKRVSSEYLKSLEGELARARVVPSKDIPPNVITMNSQMRLVDLESGEELVYTLVYPEAADLSKGRISILAPIGTAVLGYQTGDIFTWQVPDGVRRLEVREVLYQPEAAGDFDL